MSSSIIPQGMHIISSLKGYMSVDRKKTSHSIDRKLFSRRLILDLIDSMRKMGWTSGNPTNVFPKTFIRFDVLLSFNFVLM